MKRIGIIAALPSELRPLTRHWRHQGGVATGHIGSIEAIAACAGMGEKAVTRACERAFAVGDVDTLISVGYAGSLSCGLRAPEAVPVREVIDERTGESFATDPLPEQGGDGIKGQRLVTLDHVAEPEEKRRLAATHQAVLVDMEAATVARFARDHHLGFLCCKAVTDGPNDELPDFNRFTTGEGKLRTGAFARWAMVHPRYWRILVELEKNSKAGAEELAKFVVANFASPSSSPSVS
jgi:adenosylhomocysteine nucleosidase